MLTILKKLIQIFHGVQVICKIYPETNGDISGIIGRYSGQLVVNFDRYDDGTRQSLVFNCKKFEPIEKKF